MLYFSVRKATKRRVDSIEVYITSDYSVVFDKEDIKAITECVHEALYEMPRPTDYSVADILSTVNLYVNTQMEINMTKHIR